MITNTIALAWMIGTGILMVGISWGTVKVMLKNFEQRLNERDEKSKERDRQIACLDKRLDKDEQQYTRRDQCKADQMNCEKHRDYHESKIIEKLDDLKKYIEAFSGRLDIIGDRISKLEQNLPNVNSDG